MESIQKHQSSGWDRTFLRMSSTLAEPLCGTYKLFRYRLFAPLSPNIFDNCITLTGEIGFRTLIGIGGVFGAYLFAALPIPMTCGIALLGGGSKLLRAIGFSLQKDGFTHVRGDAQERTLEESLKIMSWNVCGIGGGFHYDHGGVIDWQSRLNGIVEKIEKENPDVLVLQEIYDTALGESLIERLKDRYAHFFFHLGKSVMGSVGGCMVLSKCGIHTFSNTEFTTNDWTLKRGFAALEVKASPKDDAPVARVIGTHLIHYDDERGRSVRVKQIAQIIDHIARQRLALPTILAGDLNIERDKEEGEILLPYLRHGYTRPESTATNRLVWQWDQSKHGTYGETIDYISLFRERLSLPVIESGIEFTDCHLSSAYDENYDTRTALSDHNAVVATIHLGKKKADPKRETESQHAQGDFINFESTNYSKMHPKREDPLQAGQADDEEQICKGSASQNSQNTTPHDTNLGEQLSSDEKKLSDSQSSVGNEVQIINVLDSDKLKSDPNQIPDSLQTIEKVVAAENQTSLEAKDSDSTSEHTVTAWDKDLPALTETTPD